jgi:hypothetical protein
MSTTLYIIFGVVLLVIVVVVAKFIKKSAYSKAVYSEVEKLEEGKRLNAQIQIQPEQVRQNLAMMEIEVLKVSYKKSIAPSVAAQAMIGAVNEMLSEQQKH